MSLVNAKHEVWFLNLQNNFIPYEEHPLLRNIKYRVLSGVKKRSYQPNEMLLLLPDLERALLMIKPDIVHAGPIQSCALMVALLGYRPLVAMSWGSDILVDANRDDFWRWMTLFTLKHSDIFVCDCKAVREKTQTLMPYPDSRIVQFPWGIDLNQAAYDGMRYNPRKHLGWESNFVILSTRSWEPIYGIDVVIRAFSLAYQKDKSLRLFLIGTGTLKDETNRLINSYGLNNVVYTPGRLSQEELLCYYQHADLYLSCSKSDGTSVSLLEAMAMDLPVIVTDIPGNREWIKQDENGWLIPEGDSQLFATALLDARISPEKRIAMGLRNRQIVENRANWKSNFSLLLDAYRKIEEEYGQR